MIGLMVGLLLAGLLGWYFYSTRGGGNLTSTSAAPVIITTADGIVPATAPPGSVINGIAFGPDGKPSTTDGTSQTLAGTTFMVTPSSMQKLAISTGATSYDPNNPATAARTVNGIYVATQVQTINQAGATAYNAANGTSLTADQWGTMQATVKAAANQTTQLQEISNGGGYNYAAAQATVSAPTSTPVTPGMTQAQSIAAAFSGNPFGLTNNTPPAVPPPSPGPGYYYNYTTLSWQPMLV